MVRLILYECRKHFFKKSIFIAIFLFALLNVAKAGSIYNGSSLLSQRYSPLWGSLYRQQYPDYKGEITLEKIDRLMKLYRPLEQMTADLTASTAMDNPQTLTGNVYSDYFFFRDSFVRPMEYCYLYEQKAEEIVGAARDNIQFYRALGNLFEERRNTVIADLYEGRKIQDFAYTEMYQYYLPYGFSILLCLLLCIYSLNNVFVTEKETGMDYILLTAKKGGYATIAAKIISAALFITVVSSFFWLVDFLAFSAFFETYDGGSLPLYALQNFEYAGINLSLSQYAFLSAGLKTAGMLTAGMLYLMVSSLFRSPLLPFVINLAGTSILLAASWFCMGSGFLVRKAANPFLLFVNYQMFRRTEYMNFCGYPVQSFIPLLFSAFFWSITFIGLILICSGRNPGLKKGGGKLESVSVGS